MMKPKSKSRPIRVEHLPFVNAKRPWFVSQQNPWSPHSATSLGAYATKAEALEAAEKLRAEAK